MRILVLEALGLGVAAALACPGASLAGAAQPARTGGSQVSLPPVSGLARAAARCAALVEGRVERVTFSYSEASGPRTNFHISVEVVHAGSVPRRDLVVSQFGGFLPNGKFAGATHVPKLAEGRRYLLALQSTAETGFWSGVVEDYVFAIENEGGKEVLVGEEGQVLKEMSLLGPRFGGAPVFAKVRFDGTTYRAPGRLAAAAQDTREGIDARSAATAIRQAAEAEGVSIGGSLASAVPPWKPWNRGPVAAAVGLQGGAQ
ncbi:MAG: hypothetical protein HYZ29_24920 [Myxococcales bacterium]|nr:hypothetical protein [Myxococcales bacterium]